MFVGKTTHFSWGLGFPTGFLPMLSHATSPSEAGIAGAALGHVVALRVGWQATASQHKACARARDEAQLCHQNDEMRIFFGT